ncbi:MAG: dephospho-CoA kinase [Chloroflexota bacterium]|nr:dephospho-CoA kinase [Chloroflexota bacterium]
MAGWLAAAGAAVVDADAVAREVTERGEPALAAILEAFGPTVRRPDGSLDRAALAAIVFADAAALRRLEAIVRPAVRPRLMTRVEAVEAAGAEAVAIEAIGLVEGGLAELCDEVWLITCAREAQRGRLAKRGMGGADADRRIKSQADLGARVGPYATRTIVTDGPPDDTQAKVRAAFEEALHGSRPRVRGRPASGSAAGQRRSGGSRARGGQRGSR